MTDKNPETSGTMTTTASPITPMAMLQIAVEQNADLDKLQQLMDLQERWEKNEARKAYIKAIAAFKADPPEIFKTRRVHYETSKGDTDYMHAELDQVSAIIGKALSQHGLSHAWKTEQLQGGLVRVSCVITHELGHSESVHLQAGPDQSGGKNNIQAVGSTITYLQRYTLLPAVGLAAGPDTDATDITDIEWITPEQAADLQALADEVGANVKLFLNYMGAQSLDRIQSCDYQRAVNALEAKRNQ